MNYRYTLLFLTIVVGVFANKERALDLTDDDFASSIADIDVTLVMFHDKWCENCAEAMPEFVRASELLRKSNQPIALARVDCAEGGKETCLEHSVELDDYPIYRIFRMGIAGQDYRGPDKADGMVKYLKSRYGVASTELRTLDEIEEFLKVPEESAIIGFFEKGGEGDKIKSLFERFADHYKADYRFGHSNSAEVLSKYNKRNSIVFFRAPKFQNKFEPNSVAFKGDSIDGLASFIKKNVHGLVGHRTTENDPDFDHPNVIVYYAVDYVNNVKRTNYWRNRVLQVAKDFPDFKFAISSTKDFKLEVDNLAYKSIGEKPVVAAHDKDDKIYKMFAEFSIENLRQFVSDLKEGKLEQYKKSEDIPLTNDGPVKIAVARNFDEIVYNNGKDTFLEVYAPWCAYCRDLASVIDELGEKMIDEDVEIVKFDGSNNEVPKGFDLQGYPTIFWLPKDSKDKPIMYDGGKYLEAFIEYIAEHATSELKNYDRSGDEKKTEL